jgi:hypothetical protein
MAPSHPTYRQSAPILRQLGWRSPIPTRPGTKAPDVPRDWPGPGGWGIFAAAPPTDAQITEMARSAHPSAGESLVVNGDFICIDGDIRPKRGELHHDARLAAARDLTPRLVRLAFEVLGPTGFIRLSDSPKFALFYAPAAPSDAITIDVAGNPVEVFGDPASARQIVIYGIHPDAGTPYSWVGPAAPLTHGPGHLPRVSADQLREYHDRANEMALAHEFMRLAPTISRGTHDRALQSTSHRPVSSGVIGGHMTAVLRAIGRNPGKDPRELAREHLRHADERYNTMSGCLGALIVCGYSDPEIILALEDTYRELFTADELRSHMAAFYASPAGLRKALSRGFMSPLLPVTELDRQLNTASWSPFRPRGHEAR